MLFDQAPLRRRKLIVGISGQKLINVLVAIHSAVSRSQQPHRSNIWEESFTPFASNIIYAAYSAAACHDQKLTGCF
jgi:hypothetical protein